MQDNQIVKVISPDDHDITRGNLCIKGRFGFQHVRPKSQPTSSTARRTLTLVISPMRRGPSVRILRVMPVEDLTLGTPDLRALARRAALPAAAAAALVIAVVVLGGPLQAFADALKRALDADPRWVVAAAAFELLSFGGYIALLWLVGHRASSRLGLRETTQITLGGAAATRLLPTAGAGGAALTLWALRRSGMTTRSATRTLLTFLVLMYSIFLLSVAVTGYVDALEGEPLALTALPAGWRHSACCWRSPPC